MPVSAPTSGTAGGDLYAPIASKTPAPASGGTLYDPVLSSSTKTPGAPVKSTPAPSAFTAPLFGPKTPAPVNPVQPFQTPTSKMTAAQSSAFTAPNPTMPSLYDQVAGKTVAPSFTQKLGSDVKSIWDAPASIKTPITPKSYLDDVYGKDGLVGNALSSWQKTVADMDTASKQEPGSAKAFGGLAQTGLDAINAFFSPVSTVFEKAATIPGPIGKTADFVNRFFSSLGAIGGDSASALVEASPLSDEHKAVLAPLASQIGALAAQIAAGKVGGDAVGALKDKTSSFLDTLHKDSLVKELQSNSAMQAHIAKLQDPASLPVSKVPDRLFTKSSAIPEVGNFDKHPNTMHPALRADIRDALDKHGPAATHAALIDEHGMTDTQAQAHIKEAPVPQNVQEELDAHNKAMRTTLLSAPENQLLLSEPKQATTLQGEGFSVTDKADKGKIATMKTINDYRAARDSFNKNPTPKSLDAVRTARTAMDNALKAVPKVKTVKTPVEKPVSNEISSEPPVKTEKVPAKEPELTIDRPVDESGQRVTKAANDINEALVKKGVEQLPEELQSKYTTGSYKDSVAKTTGLMSKDIESVKSMAKTGEGIPDGVHPQILFNAVEAYATKNADVGLLRDLAASPLGTHLSEAGGELGSHGFNDNPNSAVSRIREVSKSREEGFTKMNQGKKSVDEVKSTVSELKKVRSASAPKIKDWNSFVKSLQC